MSSRSKKASSHRSLFMLQWWPMERDGDDKALRCDCRAFLFLLLSAPFPSLTESWRKRGGLVRGESCSVHLWEKHSNSSGRFHLHSGTAVRPNWDNSHLWYNFIPTSVWLLWSHAPIPLSTVPPHPLTLPHITAQCQWSLDQNKSPSPNTFTYNIYNNHDQLIHALN